MPWCPNCKNEYVEGTKECADCKAALVETLEERKAIIFGEEKQMEKLKEFLEYSNLSSVSVEYNENDDTYEVFVKEEDEKQAKKLARVFLQEEEKGNTEQEAAEQANTKENGEADNGDDSIGDAEKNTDGETETGGSESTDGNIMRHTGVYQNSAAKAEDNKSSAYTLLLVGGVGMLVIILCMLGIIDLSLNETSKYMVYGVMGALFILFLVMGVVSLRSSKIFAQKAQKEDSLTEEIRKWCLEDLSAGKVDALFQEEAETLSGELKYFRRTELMKKLISEKFLNLDEAYLEHFVDEIYPDIFERDEKAE